MIRNPHPNCRESVLEQDGLFQLLPILRLGFEASPSEMARATTAESGGSHGDPSRHVLPRLSSHICLNWGFFGKTWNVIVPPIGSTLPFLASDEQSRTAHHLTMMTRPGQHRKFKGRNVYAGKGTHGNGCPGPAQEQRKNAEEQKEIMRPARWESKFRKNLCERLIPHTESQSFAKTCVRGWSYTHNSALSFL